MLQQVGLSDMAWRMAGRGDTEQNVVFVGEEKSSVDGDKNPGYVRTWVGIYKKETVEGRLVQIKRFYERGVDC